MKHKDSEDFSEIQINSAQELKKIKTAHHLQQETARATDRLAPKPFVQEFSGLRNLARTLVFVLSVISIATAIAFFYYKFVASVGVLAGAIMAICILLAVELGKNELFNIAFKRFFTYGMEQITYVLFAGAGVFLAGSFYTSLEGAKEAYLNVDKSVILLDSQHETHTDSVRKTYQNRIEQSRGDLNEFRKSVTWQGQINIYDPNVANNLRTYQQRIEKLEKDRDALLKSTQNNHNTQRSETAKAQGFNVSFWVIFASITEILLIVCSWFLNWFDYKTATEPHILTANSGLQNLFANVQRFAPILTRPIKDLANAPKTWQVLNQDLTQDLLSQNQDLKQDLTQDLTKKKIGFMASRQDLAQHLPPTLEQALAQGFTDTRLLTKHYGVNINTVSEARKDCQNKNAPSTAPTRTPTRTPNPTLDLFASLEKKEKFN